MTLEAYFEKFDLLADTPHAVARIREALLQLAVQGKLVKQDHGDGNAKQLLAAIAIERNERKRNLRIPQQPLSTDGATNRFEIPANWVWTQLGNVALQIQYGYTASADPLSSEIRMLRITDIQDNRVDWSSVPGCRIDEGEAERYLLTENDILVARTGGTIGKSFIVLNAPVRSVFASYLIRITPPRSMAARYLKIFLESTFYWMQLRNMSAGTGQPNVNGQALGRLEIPLAPLAEQKRIVAKVDELMALCDRLEAQREEREVRRGALARASLARFADAPTPANLEFIFHKSYDVTPADLRKSILTLAVQGKLVPQDPNDEPAARLLERIDNAPKRAMRTRKTDDDGSTGPSELEPLFELPPGWEWAPFRRLPLQASVGIDRGRSMQGPDQAFGYFKMNNIRNSGGVDLSDLTRIDATPDEVEEFALADGDFLFNTRNSRELVGKTCVFRAPSDDPVLYNNNILRVKFIDGFSPDFLDYWFRSPEGSAELEKLKSNTTNVCAIYQGKLSGFPCVIPPLAEQRRIVAKVDQLMALVDQLETQVAASRATGTNLTEAMVSELAAAA